MALNNPHTNKYLQLFNAMQINSNRVAEIDSIVKKINAGKARYQAVETITGVPWFFIGVLHYMEASCDFTKHLHNGDPLTARTVQVPAGRPKTGAAPFTWQTSAIDALTYKGYNKVTEWTVPNIIFLFEKFNGMGYHSKGINSPYLWSFSNQYSKGKYVKDGVYDANAVSKQAGAAVILKRVMEKNNLLTAVVATGGAVTAISLILLFFF
jgi:lysozyme family protein